MSRKNPYYRGAPTDHFDGHRFFNPGYAGTDKSLADLLRWRFGERRSPWPKTVAITPAVPEARVGGLRVTMIGHASTLIQVDGINLLTDPVWSKRASPLSFAGPKRVTRPGIDFDRLPPVDAVLISHNHYDHLDLATLKRLKSAHDPLFIMPLGNDTIVRSVVPEARIAVGDWGERFDIAEGVAVWLTQANHWSARATSDRRMALWAGHYLKAQSASVWFAGDTGYGTGATFRDIRAMHGSPDLALIPIGAYEPRWFMAPQHVNPNEAVAIMRDVGAKRAIGIHWGTFQLTDEGREAPLHALEAALSAFGFAPAHFHAAQAGDVFDF